MGLFGGGKQQRRAQLEARVVELEAMAPPELADELAKLGWGPGAHMLPEDRSNELMLLKALAGSAPHAALLQQFKRLVAEGLSALENAGLVASESVVGQDSHRRWVLTRAGREAVDASTVHDVVAGGSSG